mgnify:CR=1 FL=1
MEYEYTPNYKAGDFSTGKMGEIFKQTNKKQYSIISHKQFDNFVLIKEDFVKELVLLILTKDSDFIQVMRNSTKAYDFDIDLVNLIKLYDVLGEEYILKSISDFFDDRFESWFEILVFLSCDREFSLL